MKPRLLLALACTLVAWTNATADETRRWTGAEHFAIPLHDWSVDDGHLLAEPAAYDGRWREFNTRLYKSTAVIGDEGRFTMSFQVLRLRSASQLRQEAGVWLGLKSRIPNSPRNVWIHPPKSPLFVGVDKLGAFHVGPESVDAKLDVTKPIAVTVRGALSPTGDVLEATASPEDGAPVTLRASLPAGSLAGSMCLMAKGKATCWDFGRWTLEGDAVEERPENAAGPILWTQYTLQDDGTLKLQAQMVPLEATDAQVATLEFQRDGAWQEVARASLEPFSSTFLFRVENVAADQAIPYRVAYAFGDEVQHWSGAIRANPRDENEFTLAAFSCDHGEIFPQDTMVANVAVQDPDLLYFAGDQIYENMDTVRIVREPLEGARLSYLSKWYQFGLTWRHLLKDRPSVIIPDDHDVFMGNLWGDNGLGYVMQPEWVNMIERTMTGSLPDPVDPAPIERGIGVYFTALDYAGMSFAVVEDRKFKSLPANFKFKRPIKSPEDVDVPDAVLLGERQHEFLRDWTARTNDLPARFFLSQTLFSRGSTHTGPELKRSRFDLDSNGWPQQARNEALRTVAPDTIMIHGDQHLGLLARYGIDTWDDGPLAFMVTGTSVGFPRAWWPDAEPRDGLIDGRAFSGRYIDDLGHPITVYGVTNPKPLAEGVTNAVVRPDYADQGAYLVQQAKGSGHGVVTVDKAKRQARFDAFHLDFDATDPRPTDQFDGFPITLPLR